MLCCILVARKALLSGLREDNVEICGKLASFLFVRLRATVLLLATGKQTQKIGLCLQLQLQTTVSFTT